MTDPESHYFRMTAFPILFPTVRRRYTLLLTLLAWQRIIPPCFCSELASTEYLRQRRTAETGSEPPDFQRLDCNKDLAGTPCRPWSTIFGNSTRYNQRIVIECGTCVTMDHRGPSVRFEKGIDVQGKLVFPNGYKISIETRSIFVQGELEIISTSIITDVPKISVSLFGNQEVMLRPIQNNRLACEPEGCKGGERSITVAGGKLNCK